MDSAGAKSTISRDMQELTQGKEDISHQVRGHKANLSNPNTSEKSKEQSRQTIDNLGGDVAHYGGEDQPRSKTAAEALDGSRAMGR
ncbi:putative conidiation protein con-6 [Rosellinia necatrix]|uniref:Putative conidiation protein con-6 n=1 Tax=Rosellinia necatrix TaxID=77044 RepID=A0A1S8A9J9_ROSNE|nr:putative conidiation protein con-6 [Rosellinia necatrix]